VVKADCERAVREVFGEQSTIARAGLIRGPHENVGRLPW
jgi:2'-hydroxyisoflavone reductase